MSATAPLPTLKFYKIRSRVTGLWKTAGIGGWAKKNRPGHVWDGRGLKAHLCLWKRDDGTYHLPDEYEIIEFVGTGTVVPLQDVMPKDAVMTFFT